MGLAVFAFLSLSLAALLSVVAGRPWTTRIARRTTERDLWDHPLFKETNMVLSLAWSVAFAATALVLWVSDSGAVVLGLTFFNTGLGLISPWLGKRYAAWREPAYRRRG